MLFLKQLGHTLRELVHSGIFSLRYILCMYLEVFPITEITDFEGICTRWSSFFQLDCECSVLSAGIWFDHSKTHLLDLVIFSTRHLIFRLISLCASLEISYLISCLIHQQHLLNDSFDLHDGIVVAKLLQQIHLIIWITDPWLIALLCSSSALICFTFSFEFFSLKRASFESALSIDLHVITSNFFWCEHVQDFKM